MLGQQSRKPPLEVTVWLPWAVMDHGQVVVAHHTSLVGLFLPRLCIGHDARQRI